MDSFKSQNIKSRKTKVNMKESQVQILLNLFFRAIEIIVVFVTIAKLIYQLVLTFENSSERFNGLAALLVNRHLVFVLGNAIIVALFAQSGWNPNQESDPQSTNNCFYEEFVRENRRDERYSPVEMKTRGKQITVEGIKKRSICGNMKKRSTGENRGEQSTGESTRKQRKAENRVTPNLTEDREKQNKKYERSRTENFEDPKKSRERLRRSETEKYSDKFMPNEKIRELDDDLSSDELRYKIETFIARQRRYQTDEEFCIN